MKHRLTIPLKSYLRAVFATTALQLSAATAGTLYWDTNGNTPGSGNAGGSWTAAANWSTSADGDTATQLWVNGENAVFSAGTDGIGSLSVIITGTVATPSIKLEETGLVTLSGGAIDITGGATFDTSALGFVGGRQLFWYSSIVGDGPLTLAVHGSTSDSGDGSNSFMVFDGLNSFTGDVTILSGVVRANSNLGPVSNKVILNGGGIVDPNLNLNFPYDIQIDAGQSGTYRTWGSVATGQASGAILGGGTLRHTDGGTLNLTGDGSAFSGTIDNLRGTVTLTTNNWSGTHFVNSDGAALRFNAPGTTTIRSYAGDRDVFIPAGSRLDVATGVMSVVTGTDVNAFVVQPATGGGALTSSSGTLTLNWDTPYTVQGTHSISVRVEDFDGSTPLALVKNGPGALSGFNQANTYTGGTTINGGRVAAQNAQAFGLGKVAVTYDDDNSTGGQAWLNLGGGVFANDFDIAGIGPLENAGNLGAIRFDNNTTISGKVTLTADARMVAWSGAVATHSGILAGSSDLEINLFDNATANGTVNLTGDLTGFTGDLIVSRGRLHIPGGAVGGGLFVDDGATISGEPSIAGPVTFGLFDGGRIVFDGATPGALHAQGNLTLKGVTTVVPASMAGGTSTVMTYGGTLTGDASNLDLAGGLAERRPGTGFDLSETGKIKLNLVIGDLSWTGGESQEWNSADLNWLNGATPDRFYSGDKVTFGDNVAASFATNLPAANNDLVFLAVAPGAGGADVTIEYVDTFAANTPLAIGVVGNAITVTLATDGDNNITTTAAEVKAAIEASPAAAALVKVAFVSGNDGSGLVAGFDPQNLVLTGIVTIPTGLAVTPQSAMFANSTAVGYLLSGPGTLTNAPIVKTGTGTLTIGHPSDYNQATAIVTGTSSIVIEEGNLAFSSRTALATNMPITLGSTNSGNAPTILEVPRAAAGDQLVLATALTLGTLADGSTSEAIVRYTGVSNGSTTTNGAPTVQGTVNLNGRDLYLENTSPVTGASSRLWNFQPAISGTGNMRVRAHANPDGSSSGAGRVRIQSTANNWNGNLYLDRGELQIGFTGQVIPDNALAIFSPGSRMTMGNTAETIRGLVGGGATQAIPFTSDLASNTGNTSTVRITLTDTNADNTHVYDGRITNGSPGFMALTKAGAATQVLNGPCSFTGTTLLNGGRLVVNNTYTSAITVAAGATLAGTMTSTAAVTATAAGARVSPGNPTGTLTAASANLTTGGILAIGIDDASTPKSGKIVTTGVLNLTNATLQVAATGAAAEPVYVIASYGSLTGTFATTTIPAGYELVYGYNDGNSSNNIALVRTVDPYTAWIDGYPVITGADRAPDADFDNDGVPNGIEFVLGSDPTSAASTGELGRAVSGGNLVLTFKRSVASKAYAVAVEHGTTLTAWPGLIPVPTVTTSGPPVSVIVNAPNADDVTVTIPMGADPKKFARIRVDIPFTP